MGDERGKEIEDERGKEKEDVKGKIDEGTTKMGRRIIDDKGERERRREERKSR